MWPFETQTEEEEEYMERYTTHKKGEMIIEKTNICMNSNHMGNCIKYFIMKHKPQGNFLLEITVPIWNIPAAIELQNKYSPRSSNPCFGVHVYLDKNPYPEDHRETSVDYKFRFLTK